MSILIGHASIDENGKSQGGVAGDQTGKEVCTRAWYSKPWDFMAVHPTASVREKHASAVKAACDNDCIGYDQNQRNTLNTQAKVVNYDLSAIKTACETDCSALQNVCAICSGAVSVSSYGSNGWTTSTMLKNLLAAGYKVIVKNTSISGYSALTADQKKNVVIAADYLVNEKYAVRGAIYVKAGSHTVCALENGASYKDTLTALSLSGTTTQAAASSGTYTKTDFIKEVQKAIGVTVDGSAGSKTLAATPTLSATKNRKHAAVKPVQKRLYALGYTTVGTADGVAGTKFTAAVKAYQKAIGATVDGEITAKQKTWKKLLGIL